MKKINIIKKNEDYNRIIKEYKPYKYKDYVVYVEWTSDKIYHFGFSVGKKIGNAVTRNKVKRKLKAILDNFIFKNGFNCIIIVRRGILDKSFLEMQTDINAIIEKIKIKKGEYK